MSKTRFTSSYSKSSTGQHFFPIAANARTETSVMVCDDGETWISITMHNVTESEVRSMFKCAKKAGFEVEPKQLWLRGASYEQVKRKMDAHYFSQSCEIRHGTTRIEYIVFVDLT